MMFKKESVVCCLVLGQGREAKILMPMSIALRRITHSKHLEFVFAIEHLASCGPRAGGVRPKDRTEPVKA